MSAVGGNRLRWQPNKSIFRREYIEPIARQFDYNFLTCMEILIQIIYNCKKQRNLKLKYPNFAILNKCVIVHSEVNVHTKRHRGLRTTLLWLPRRRFLKFYSGTFYIHCRQ